MSISDEYLKDKIAVSLYSLNNSIEHWREITELISNNFNFVDFQKNPQIYCEKKFASSYGKEVPQYLSIYYDKNSIDLNTAKDWIKNFK